MLRRHLDTALWTTSTTNTQIIRHHTMADIVSHVRTPHCSLLILLLLGNGKLANVLFAKQLQRQFDHEGVNVLAISLHPGNSNTFSYLSPFPGISEFLMRFMFMAPDVGAYTTVFAAASPIPQMDARYKGAYLRPIARLSEATSLACNEELAAELWETTEKIVAGFQI
jgi:hypothetical protein